MDEEIVMYILINSDLKMDKGKIAAQACHSACKVVYYLSRVDPNSPNSNFIKWLASSYTKIVLRTDTNTMEHIEKKYHDKCRSTHDEGRTQIKKGSLTSIAFFPMPKNKVPEELKGMKLL